MLWCHGFTLGLGLVLLPSLSVILLSAPNTVTVIFVSCCTVCSSALSVMCFLPRLILALNQLSVDHLELSPLVSSFWINVPSYFPQLTLHSSYLRHQMLELWVTLHPCSSSKVNKSNETQVQTNTIRCLHCMTSYCDVRYTFSVTVLMSVKPQQLLEELFSC